MDADLIVLGSRGVAGPRRPFWGSTAERVVTTARCSVLIVPVPVEIDGAGEPEREIPAVTQPASCQHRVRTIPEDAMRSAIRVTLVGALALVSRLPDVRP